MSILALPSYVQKLPKRARIPLQTCIYGLGAGIVTVAFQVGMSRLYDATFVNLSHQSIKQSIKQENLSNIKFTVKDYIVDVSHDHEPL